MINFERATKYRALRLVLTFLPVALLLVAAVTFVVPGHEVSEVGLDIPTGREHISTPAISEPVWRTHSNLDDSTFAMIPLLASIFVACFGAIAGLWAPPGWKTIAIFCVLTAALWYWVGLTIALLSHAFAFGTSVRLLPAGIAFEVAAFGAVLLNALNPIAAYVTSRRSSAETGQDPEPMELG